jgi:phosphohistidine phosphatase
MKHLLLLRHAKAVNAENGMADRDRPLSARGHRDATLMGSVIASEPPDLILCSPARRTRETLVDVLQHLKQPPPAVYVDALYDGGSDYRDVIAQSGGAASRVLLVGHNPAVHRTALSLTGAGDAALYAMLGGKFPTAALAMIAFSITDWTKLTRGSGELLALQRPRDLGALEDDD